ncbi:hypothetical protein ACFLSX_04965 [Calditrichota bacterium]
MNKKLSPEKEAEHIVKLSAENQHIFSGLKILREQFGVLQTRSSFILTLCTITLTITGFSGHRIAATNQTARILLVLGLIFTISCLFVLLIGSLKIHWSTQIRSDTALSTLSSIIKYRNQKTNMYIIELFLLVAGLVCYVGSVIVFLLYFQT